MALVSVAIALGVSMGRLDLLLARYRFAILFGSLWLLACGATLRFVLHGSVVDSERIIATPCIYLRRGCARQVALVKRADEIRRWLTAGALGLFVCLAVAASPPPAEAGAAEPGEYVYVTNEDSRNITVIDARNDSVVTTIEVGTRPRGVKVSPDGRTVYVALSGSPKCPPSMPDEECQKQKTDRTKDGVAVVDVASRRVVRILPVGSDPEAFDVSRDGGRLFVSNEDADSASIIDLAKGTVISNVKTGKEPEGVTVAPDGKTFWVTAETDHNITGIDTQSGAVVGVLEVGMRPRAIAFVHGGAKAFVTNEAGGTVTVIDMAARKAVKTITMPEGALPMGLAVAPDGKKVYVSNGRGGTVSVLDASTETVLNTAKAGTRPWGLGVTRNGKKLYTANGPGNDVSVLDAETLDVMKTVPVGSMPWGIAVGPEVR